MYLLTHNLPRSFSPLITLPSSLFSHNSSLIPRKSLDSTTSAPKITALILRPGLRGPLILAFQHPTAGLQLPAGTIDPGEGWLLRSIRPSEQPRAGAAQVAGRIGRGWPVSLTETRDGLVHVTYTESNLNYAPPLFQWSVSGWVPLDPPPALIPPQDGWLRWLPAQPAPAEVLFEQGDLARVMAKFDPAAAASNGSRPTNCSRENG